MILLTISIVLIRGQLGMDTGQMVPIRPHNNAQHELCSISQRRYIDAVTLQYFPEKCDCWCESAKGTLTSEPDPCTLVCIP